jgi:signal transduction histidine kinase
LDFARPPTLQRRSFDLCEVLQQTLDLVSARAAHQQISIECQGADESIEIHADREQIRQVLLNVILNSLDAVPKGGNIRLELSVDEVPLETEARLNEDDAARPRNVEIRVVDSGPGIPDELGARIFEPFVSSKETGLGLGLPICRRIVEAHGGAITAGNAPDGGAQIRIRLPAGTLKPVVAEGPVAGGRLN